MCIYEPNESLLHIPAFDVNQPDCEHFLARSDKFLLNVIKTPINYESISESFIKLFFKACSTSPQQEPDDFIENIRWAFRICKEHPTPLQTYFIEGRPHVYKRVETRLEWVKIDSF
jgi:hypothetical protein